MPSVEKSSGADARPDLRIIDASHRFNGAGRYMRMDKPQEDLSIFGKSKYVPSPSPELTPEDIEEARAILWGTNGPGISFADRVRSWLGMAKKTALVGHHELSPEDADVRRIVTELTAPRKQSIQASEPKQNTELIQVPKPI